MEESEEIKSESKLSKFNPPDIDMVDKIAAPLRMYFRPRYFGIDEVDDSRPALYVTNHTVYGLTDGLLFGLELFKRREIFLRPLVDNLHFEIPVWKDWIPKLGFVKANRENCSALMNAGENILVFPGGSRETCKRKGEQYKLIWKDHVGFARMAIQYGYDIIPVAQVGGDDAYDIIADADDIMKSWIGKFMKESKIFKDLTHDGDFIPPITKGLFGFTPIPKRVKLYISFGDRIDTSHYRKKYDNEENLWLLRNEVELSMSKQILHLLEFRKSDNKGFFNLFG